MAEHFFHTPNPHTRGKYAAAAKKTPPTWALGATGMLVLGGVVAAAYNLAQWEDTQQEKKLVGITRHSLADGLPFQHTDRSQDVAGAPEVYAGKIVIGRCAVYATASMTYNGDGEITDVSNYSIREGDKVGVGTTVVAVAPHNITVQNIQELRSVLPAIGTCLSN